MNSNNEHLTSIVERVFPELERKDVGNGVGYWYKGKRLIKVSDNIGEYVVLPTLYSHGDKEFKEALGAKVTKKKTCLVPIANFHKTHQFLREEIRSLDLLAVAKPHFVTIKTPKNIEAKVAKAKETMERKNKEAEDANNE